jgi:hypothetical protein
MYKLHYPRAISFVLEITLGFKKINCKNYRIAADPTTKTPDGDKTE